MQSRIDDLLALGASVVTISTSSVDKHREIAISLGAEFPILSDPDGAVVRRYGLLHPGAHYRNSELPVARPAVFLIDRGLVIRRRFLTDNWRVRMHPETLIEALREL